MDTLMEKTCDSCRCIKGPNLYGYNLFWPQLRKWDGELGWHISKKAIDIDRYSDEEKDVIKYIVGHLDSMRNSNTERMYQEGASIEDIVECIMERPVYASENIKKL